MLRLLKFEGKNTRMLTLFPINFVWLHRGSGHIASSGYGYKTPYRLTSSAIKIKEKK